MNPAHVHLVFNHVPILGSIFGTLILIYGLLGRNKPGINIALITLFASALAAIPAFLSGEPAEETIEHFAGVSEAAIEKHEEGAEFAFWIMEGLGAIALITWFMLRKGNKVANQFMYFTLLVSLGTSGLMLKVANEGGKIRHSEITGTVSSGQNNHSEVDENTSNDAD